MKKVIISGSLAWFILFAAGPLMAKGNDGRPALRWKLTGKIVLLISTDSIPGQPKNPGRITGQPATDSIREVPKARNQVAPAPITQQIKPIKLIKPIIRPVIRPVVKVLH